ncbi:hypothetical protein UT300019_29020 [Clostridium sp. CTA-19]
MRELKKSEKVLISILIFLLLILVVSKLAIFPYRLNAISLKSQVEEKRKKLDYAVRTQEQLGERVSSLNKLKKELNSSSKRLPTGKQTPDIAKEIRELAEKNLINLVDINFEDIENNSEVIEGAEGENTVEKAADLINDVTKDEKREHKKNDTTKKNTEVKVDSIYVNFTVIGDYKQTLNFLANVENSQRICEINAVAMTGNNPTKTSVRMEFFFNELDGELGKYKHDFNKGQYGKENMFK